ncbi:MAG TPA: arsenate reductase ArsC [bacterium]|nr:arsenate reductase ArsC [bacterium]
MTAKPRVLFLCTHNAARSQMAEGIMRHLGHGAVDVYSAGTEPSHVHPLAVKAVRRLLGVDIGNQRSKHLNEFVGQRFDYVITVCDRAREACPVFPGDPERIHWSFDDPAAVQGSEDERYRAFRTIAAELSTRIRQLLVIIERNAKPATA